MQDYHIQGDFARAEDGSIHGWCWSPDHPADRLTVEILADGAVIGDVIANTLRPDLKRQGKGDGCCGFTIAASDIDIPARTTLLSLRERETRRIFGRRRLARGQVEPNPRLDILAGVIRDLRSRVDALPEAAGPARSLRAGFGIVASRLNAAHAGEVAAAFNSLTHASRVTHSSRAGLAPGAPPRRTTQDAPIPEYTLVVQVRDAAHVSRALDICRVEMASGTAELFVWEAGTDPHTKLLAAVLPCTRFLRATECASLAAALRIAAVHGRGRYMIAIEADEGAPLSRSGLASCLNALREGAKMLVGPRTTRYAARMGFSDAVRSTGAMPCAGTEPVICGIERDLFLATGGPSPASDDVIAVTVLDMALRATLLRVPSVWIDGVSENGREQAAATTAAMAAGRALLRQYGFAP
jgi:hypothetical protein